MSLKLAIAKLSAAAAGVALLQGGAVRMAEPMNTDAPDFATQIDGKLIAVDPVTGARYIKTREREIPMPEQRRRRIVERTIECQPVGPAGTVVAASAPAGATQAYIDAAECPPIAQLASCRGSSSPRWGRRRARRARRCRQVGRRAGAAPGIRQAWHAAVPPRPCGLAAPRCRPARWQRQNASHAIPAADPLATANTGWAL